MDIYLSQKQLNYKNNNYNNTINSNNNSNSNNNNNIRIILNYKMSLQKNVKRQPMSFLLLPNCWFLLNAKKTIQSKFMYYKNNNNNNNKNSNDNVNYCTRCIYNLRLVAIQIICNIFTLFWHFTFLILPPTRKKSRISLWKLIAL